MLLGKKIIECVPNFSEGRDMNIINQITAEIKNTDGVKLLDVDPGATTNRTVVTFAGEPDAVVEAAFKAVKKATELIDMSKHKGAHPRFGATDVCPLVPVANITMQEVIEYANKLGKRIGDELGIPVYLYEFAAKSDDRRNLANVRAGEYEGLEKKLKDPLWQPDFGPAKFLPKTGAIAVGARNFLVAINYNLNTTSVRRANAIAFDVREKGRPMRKGNPITGEIVKDENGNTIYIPGTLKATKAIGWFIEEYGIAQVSMNITDISVTPVHIAFDEVSEKARLRGIRVTGAEIVGLIPKSVLIDAGKYFLKKQQRSTGVSEDELIKIAVKSMGLDDLKPFDAQNKVIEFLLAKDEPAPKLINMTMSEFADETASESPAPGGGSISAYVGALGAALATMVANLSSHKPGWDDKWEEFSNFAEEGQKIKDELVQLLEEDTNAFNKVMDAFGLPKDTDEQKNIRRQAIEEATRYATEIPYRTMKTATMAIPLCKKMAEIGNPNSISDAGVGAICCLTAIKGAYLNILINVAGLKDKSWADNILSDASQIIENAQNEVNAIYDFVLNKIK
ncbi:MAG TPA: glutamate formimidoyltransferase [Bacteroidales bacterium]|jgi:glutamate formiminotransferase/formiminotetrahydrofolate cyclodeaminase|nr:glutamate formimidoyltransferase [Bacteroidales bacterium]HOK21381.1 glutamate formimidoyltransferase [Bacteroidales bacterium]HOL74206.1 glutamate formimidoyltransferase [Bacteroidales bacterium]HPU46950.1 glutamate formimidoyltransferase [Bacteroidales bacterium]HPZ36865.1 glutamate formimidoyltransferase [Bacteroidales bacterium]